MYGSYSDLVTCLNERDYLISIGWDWDLFFVADKIPPKYDDVELPPFEHKPSYIHCARLERFKVYKNRALIDTYTNLEDAENHAKLIGGWVKYEPPRYMIKKTIDGEQKYFGCYNQLDEAIVRRNELMENNWSYGN